MATVTDDFNRADSLSLGANWTEVESSAEAAQIVSSRLRMSRSTTLRGYAYHNQALSANQYSEATFAAHSGGAFCGPCCRMDPAGSLASATMYCCIIDDGGSPDLRIHKFVNQNFSIGSGAQIAVKSFTWSLGVRVRIEANGTTIRVLVDDVEELSVEDSDISSGRAGMGAQFGTAGGLVSGDFDNFEAGDLGGAAASQNNRRPWVKRRNLIWSRHY